MYCAKLEQSSVEHIGFSVSIYPSIYLYIMLLSLRHQNLLFEFLSRKPLIESLSNLQDSRLFGGGS